ncbi:MAG TPA: glycosyltransferase family 2 protein [Calditrichaeota bacterium]|nr:glycosyltransferase family 2 protein [Calditrichota bacterium]
MVKYDILIPAFNAEKTLPLLTNLLLQLKKPPGKIWVIDDGSSDGTPDCVQHPSVTFDRLRTNHGKGFALRRGFNLFLKNSPAEYLICMDADLQHPVESVAEIVERLNHKKEKIIIGNRDKSARVMPLARVLSNKITSFILSKLTGQAIQDSQCGFRAIHRDVLQDIDLKENGFQLESEFILRTAHRGWKIDFINIPTIYNGSHSYIKHVGDTYRFIRLIIKELSGRS